MKRAAPHPAASSIDFARTHYCLCGPDGREDPIKVERAVRALEKVGASREPPEIEGVARLRFRVETLAQIPEAVRRFLPEVEASPRLHALSFVDPLRVANELGIAVAPAVARTVRRAFGGIVSFDDRSLDPHGKLRGVGNIRWIPRGGGR